MMSVDDEDDEPFAIQITKTGDLTVVCESECNELFGARDDICVVSQEDEAAPDGIIHGLRKQISIEKIRSHFANHGVYKVIGAAVTCAAPVAAYWMMR